MSEPLNVFFSYANKDEDLRNDLAIHLAILKRQGKIRPWHDRQIIAGQEWAGEIDDNLNTADLILLLVSPTFVASDYCWDIELKRALERHEAREARVIPIILRPVDWSDAPFAKLQALPKNLKPVTTWPNRDEAFLDIAKGLRTVIEDEQKRRAERQAPTVAAPPATPSSPAPAPPAAAPAAAAAPPSQLDCRTLRDRGLLDALASVFDTEASATGVLERAGVPKGRLQPFGLMTPVQYWESVCRELEKGLIAGGLAALLREAANAYPYNPLFQQGLQLTAATTAPGAPASNTPAASTAAAPQVGTPGTGTGPLALWREKLAALLSEEAIASDAAQKFTLKKQIEEARAKIRELGGV